MIEDFVEKCKVELGRVAMRSANGDTLKAVMSVELVILDVIEICPGEAVFCDCLKAIGNINEVLKLDVHRKLEEAGEICALL